MAICVKRRLAALRAIPTLRAGAALYAGSLAAASALMDAVSRAVRATPAHHRYLPADLVTLPIVPIVLLAARLRATIERNYAMAMGAASGGGAVLWSPGALPPWPGAPEPADRRAHPGRIVRAPARQALPYRTAACVGSHDHPPLHDAFWQARYAQEEGGARPWPTGQS